MSGEVLYSSGAQAEPSVTYGWWTQANPGRGLDVVAQPPDVPADGMLVQGGAESPFALAAVSFAIPSGVIVTNATLTLATAPSRLDVPSALQACAITGPVKAELGGPMANAPHWNCALATVGTLAPGGGAWSFPVTALVSGDRLSVAILGSSPTDRVALQRPQVGALQLVTQQTSSGGVMPPPSAGPAGSLFPPPVPGEGTPVLPGLVASPAPEPPPMVSPSNVSPQAYTGTRRVSAPHLLPTATALDSSAMWGCLALVVVAALSWRSKRELLACCPTTDLVEEPAALTGENA
jgi:hypothetical protein